MYWFPIQWDFLEKADAGLFKIHYWDGQMFPSLLSDRVHNQVKQTMRHVYENKAEALKKNRNMQDFIRKNFTWTHTANQAIDRLRAIKKKMESK